MSTLSVAREAPRGEPGAGVPSSAQSGAGAIVAVLYQSAPVSLARARRMLAAAPHRGSTHTIRVHDTCVLGVSHHGAATDPTLSQDGPLIAAVSGSLDNARELTTLLGNAGVPPASPAPADVTVAAFRAFGPEAPSRMRGTFSGVVTDGRQLWCFRDHIGFRPLFYRQDVGAFFAATEAKQVVAGAGLPREPDLEVLEQIFYGRMPADTPCALKGVARVPQASVLRASGDGTTAAARYWHPEALLETSRLSADEVGERFAALLEQAVDCSLTGGDVIALSGGVDSPAVAAFAAPLHRQRTGRPIAALSAVFPDQPKVDERAYIELVAKHLGIELHTYEMRRGALDDARDWCELLDGPVPTISLPELHEYYELARRLGCRNVLTGELGEFVYASPRHLTAHLLTHGRWGALLRLLRTQRRRGASWRSLLRQLVYALVPGRPANWYLRARGLDRPERIPDWLDRRNVSASPYRADLLSPPRARWAAQQCLAFGGSTIMLEADELCAALTGVTVRRPLSDVDFWEFFLSLPAEVKYPDLRSKTLVRQLLRGRLPDAILDRRDKTAFDAHVLSQVDYAALRRLLANPNHQVAGVDYRRLLARIEREDFTLMDWVWARDLARVHAFLSLW